MNSMGASSLLKAPRAARAGRAMGCRAIVTAASRGIGFIAAKAVAALGCELYVCSRSDAIVEAKRSLESLGARVEASRCDLRNRGEGARIVKEALRLLGPVDYMIMNYGNPSREPLTILEANWEDWMEASALYIASTAEAIGELVRSNAKKATFLAISSFTVLEPMPQLIVADAARAGLSRIIKVAAREYADKIRALLLLIGSFDTPGARRTIEMIARKRGEDPELLWANEVEGLSPLKRTGRAEELEEMIRLLLLSPDYLTGATVLFDGASSKVAL